MTATLVDDCVASVCNMRKVWLFVPLLFLTSALVPSHAQRLNTLHSFCTQQNCPDGNLPEGNLIQASDGNFYGITEFGGTQGCTYGCGTIFKITPGGTLTTLHTFCEDYPCPDGAMPVAALLQASDGNLYGTTSQGGSGQGNCGGGGSCGTVFRMTLNGMFTTLYNFCSQPNCTDGSQPLAGLIQATDGNLYGTTGAGGTYNGGTLFRISLTGGLTILHNFCAQPNCTDGQNPTGIVQASDGNFYGTTSSGGTSQGGTAYKITASGTFTSFGSFCVGIGNCPDGEYPRSPLIQASDGNFYGVTSLGGIDGGAVFKLSPPGALTPVYLFENPNDGGMNPVGQLLQAADGALYGTTSYGGANGIFGGTVFRLTLDGMITYLYNFCGLVNCVDGSSPVAGLTLGTDGNFYGSTAYGGQSSLGTVFRMPGPTATSTQFVPLTPCRLLDTRNSNPIPGGTGTAFVLPQLAQTNDCGDLSSATAYSLNLTLIPPGRAPIHYLTVFPTGQTQPLVSTMNSLDGRVKANAAIVPAGR